MDRLESDFEQVKEAAQFVRSRFGISKDQEVADLGIVLGSGLGGFSENLLEKNGQAISYEDIPHFPTSSVAGHSSRLVFGKVDGRPLLAMQGRVHRYEGYSASEVAFPVRVLHALGVKHLIVTNASGAIGDHLSAGDLMLITDHINLTGDNPLLGPNDSRLGPRFFDMTEAYSKRLRGIAKQAALDIKVQLKEGIYTGVLGPCYETPAEIRYFKNIGGDAVGMSTVFESIAARHLGIELMGIACLTNKAAGLSDNHLTHEEVTQTAHDASERFSRLLSKVATMI